MADFLDVTLNLNSESYYPYRKRNHRPVYIHSQSYHPPNIIKNLPASISRRLTDISSDETAFGDAKPIYKKALSDSGFCEMTEFLEDQRDSSGRRKRKNRRRNITWFNPPYSQNVSTNIGRRFRTLISKHFPGNSKLSKTVNINTLKLSYSCMPNMAAAISQHNTSILRGGRTIGENYAGWRRCTAASRRSAGGAVANRLRRRTSDQTVLGSNPPVAAALPLR